MFNTYTNVSIQGIRTVVPQQKVCIEDELEYYGGNIKKIQRLRALAGIDTRRVCPPGVTTSDLCAQAAQELLQEFPQWRDNIDALIFMTQSPDWRQPATACELQHRLHLPKTCACFDVNQGCSGYVYGLWLAGSLIQSGAAKKILLLAGDVFAQRIDPRNRILAPVFGDGGSATLLEYSTTASPMHFGLGNDGSGYDAIITPAGAGRIPFLRDHTQNIACTEDVEDADKNPWQLFDTYMDSKKVFDFTMNIVPAHIQASLEQTQTSVEQIDTLFLHQANKQIMQNVAMKAGFPLKKVPVESFSKYGNLANASIPTALCDYYAKPNAQPCAINDTVLLCGYGIGLSWASCLCTLQNINIAEVGEFTLPQNHPSRQERITFWKNHISKKG